MTHDTYLKRLVVNCDQSFSFLLENDMMSAENDNTCRSSRTHVRVKRVVAVVTCRVGLQIGRREVGLLQREASNPGSFNLKKQNHQNWNN